MNSLMTVFLVTVAAAGARPGSSNDASQSKRSIGCGQLLFTNSSGYISTPNYPIGYEDNMNCVYTIQPTNYSSFGASFRTCDCILEAHSLCGFDYIQFGATGNNTRHCGHASGRNISAASENGKVEVSFVSDGSVHTKGCFFAYSTNGPAPACPITNPTAFPTTQSWNNSYFTTSAPINWTVPTTAQSNDSIFHLTNDMYQKEYNLLIALSQYRAAVGDLINRLRS